MQTQNGHNGQELKKQERKIKPDSLLIVESPTKARTLTKYLSNNFKIIASMGHIKDLPKSKMGVDINNGFEPQYQIIDGKRSIVQKIKKEAEKSKYVYLAPDPDREGEAIAWHIAEEIGLDRDGIFRVLFNEITKKGIEEGLKNLTKLDEFKYESQKARRILDRLVGYELSPLLWKKVKKGLSAGRVQSVALRIIVEREKTIEEFVPREYWKVYCDLAIEGEDSSIFRAVVTMKDGKKIEIPDEQEAKKVKEHLLSATFSVKDVKIQTRKRNPPPPFITSKLQQEATRKLKMTAKKVMQIAQQLYEGIELGAEGAVGLITYMRTDSTRLSDDAVLNCRKKIGEVFGNDYLPPTPNVYPQKKSAQGAHEAIRPTSMEYSPEKIGRFLTHDQLGLYTLIWNRFLACQMNPALIQEKKIIIEAKSSQTGLPVYILEASSNEISFDGWMAAEPEAKSIFISIKKVSEENEEETEKDEEEGNGEEEEFKQSLKLPEVCKNQILVLSGEKVTEVQKFTKPPPRYTEGSLIKELEDKGIGRPSTYATIISTILERKYVKKFRQKLYPTPLGKIVVERLVAHFPEIMDVEFTAKMEESLDKIESRMVSGKDILREFYTSFHNNLEKAFKNMKSGIEPGEYQKHAGTQVRGDTPASPVEVETHCPACGKKMILKTGKYGLFLSCPGYPKCKQSLPVYKQSKCPQKGCDGEIVEIKLKKGKSKAKTFYGCSKYKDNGCSYTTWDTPVNKKCPKCECPTMLIKFSKGTLTIKCARTECNYSEEILV